MGSKVKVTDNVFRKCTFPAEAYRSTFRLYRGSQTAGARRARITSKFAPCAGLTSYCYTYYASKMHWNILFIDEITQNILEREFNPPLRTPSLNVPNTKMTSCLRVHPAARILATHMFAIEEHLVVLCLCYSFLLTAARPWWLWRRARQVPGHVTAQSRTDQVSNLCHGAGDSLLSRPAQTRLQRFKVIFRIGVSRQSGHCWCSWCLRVDVS